MPAFADGADNIGKDTENNSIPITNRPGIHIVFAFCVALYVAVQVKLGWMLATKQSWIPKTALIVPNAKNNFGSLMGQISGRQAVTESRREKPLGN